MSSWSLMPSIDSFHLAWAAGINLGNMQEPRVSSQNSHIFMHLTHSNQTMLYRIEDLNTHLWT